MTPQNTPAEIDQLLKKHGSGDRDLLAHYYRCGFVTTGRCIHAKAFVEDMAALIIAARIDTLKHVSTQGTCYYTDDGKAISINDAIATLTNDKEAL